MPSRLSRLIGVILLALAAPTQAHQLPLGDGKVSTMPRVGYLMSCVRHWSGRGAVHGGPWIQGSYWDPSEKAAVQGSVSWPNHRVSITVQGGERIISANNLPDHPTGIFPISPSDPAHRYDPNPNAIEAQNILLRLPVHPEAASAPSCVPMGMVGFTTDGAAVYSAVDDGGIDAVAHEVQDKCSGHPQRRGQYHYHGPSTCMANEKTSGLVGYALDGFGIYGMKDRKTGRILRNDDLDTCHGTTSSVMWDGELVNMYHYVLTEEYPYTIGCFRGTPVSSDLAGGRRAMGKERTHASRRPAGRAGGGNRERTERAARILGISPQVLREALGPPPPDFAAAARKLGVSVEDLRAALGPR